MHFDYAIRWLLATGSSISDLANTENMASSMMSCLPSSGCLMTDKSKLDKGVIVIVKVRVRVIVGNSDSMSNSASSENKYSMPRPNIMR